MRDLAKDKAMCERDWRYSADTAMSRYWIAQYEAAQARIAELQDKYLQMAEIVAMQTARIEELEANERSEQHAEAASET
ncbi:hypothetical protein GXP70_12375 [Paenibacillus lycopersici]|uniref:Uncharacterized protein n=1 Tax=Paenibacillus lycopersici TaxID=2704462 RepID=A0A6C0FU31_9BACL|nr:hypothetical protein [Paenibacillus lycopersici]QHT60656.1 hypothetical protein GXP70_12375 [Paenibacillus lycopersici]